MRQLLGQLNSILPTYKDQKLSVESWNDVDILNNNNIL